MRHAPLRRGTSFWLTVCASVVFCSSAWAGADLLKNPGFEDSTRLAIPSWQVETQGGQARVEERSLWRKLSCRLNSGRYRRPRVYVRVQFHAGTAWFDDVTLAPLKLADPGFEQAKDDKLRDWQQDNVGKTLFCDRTVAHSGKSSLRISSDQNDMSRVWQNVACRPNQDLELSAWVRSDRPLRAGAEASGLTDDGQPGNYLQRVPWIAVGFRP